MINIYDRLNYLLKNPKSITDNRMSILNGLEDLTEYGPQILSDAHAFVNNYENKDDPGRCDISECIAKIILAETYYQADNCYNALVMTNSALAFLEKKDNVEVWVVAKYIQLCIMIVTGQLKAIYPLVDSMKDDVMDSDNEQLIINYEALVAWCALYDNDNKLVDEWMEKKAPDEFEKIEFKHAFAGLVKARIYFFQEKYYSLITLLQALENVLVDKGRVMEMCEIYMLMALALYADNHKEEAFFYIGRIVKDCSQRGFVRLLADEGEPMYHMISDYIDSCGITDENQLKYLKKVRKAAKNVALEFPNYLKSFRFEKYNLTRKEQEILNLLLDNRSNQEIADFLECSVNTVKFHLKNIFKKLEVDNRKDAIALVKKNIK